MSGRTDQEFEEYGATLEAHGYRLMPVDGGHAYVTPDGNGKGPGEGGQCGVDFYWEAEEAMEAIGR